MFTFKKYAVFFNDKILLVSDANKNHLQVKDWDRLICPHLFRLWRTVHLNLRKHDLASVLALEFVNFIACVIFNHGKMWYTSFCIGNKTYIYSFLTHLLNAAPVKELLQLCSKVQTSFRRKSSKEIYSLLFCLENCSLNISCLHLSVFAAEHFPNYTKHDNWDEKSTCETGVWKQGRHCHFDLFWLFKS